MASSQVEFASSTSPFECINHRRVTQYKNLFNHVVKDHLNNDDNNKAKNNLGTLTFVSNKRDEQDESSWSSSSSSVSPNHEELSPSSSSFSSPSSVPLRKQRLNPISMPSDFSPCDYVSNHGASSLVQIWEKRLTSLPSNTTKSSSTPKYSPNYASLSSSSPSLQNSSLSSKDEEADTAQGQILHNNKGVHNHNHNHHNYQREKSVVRVADIIKRLTTTNSEEIIADNNNNNHHHQNYYCCVGSPEQKSLESDGRFVINSPRIRGRQAFNDLLMQMERDRHCDLNTLADRAPVSKFSHRGRIQSLLRLKLMQRGKAAKDYHRNLPPTTSQVIKKLPQGWVIMRLRKRFGTGIEGIGTASIEEEAEGEHETPCRENKVSSIYNPPNPNQNHMSHTSHDKKEVEKDQEAPPCSEISEPSLDAQNAETSSSSMADVNAEPEVSENVEGRREEKNHNVYDEMEEEEEVSEEEEYGERVYDEIEEGERNTEEINHGGEANNFGWISQISKPKSYWEHLRQAWYREMLDNNESQKYDICQLLQRRTVSNFLRSDFRKKMDRLMESHKITQTNLLASRDDHEANHHGKIRQQLIAFLHQKVSMNNNSPAERDQEEKNSEEDEEENHGELEEYAISGSYNGESDFMNQSSPSTSQSPSFFLHTHPNSSPTNNPPSIEMELIYDLRGQMKQLYQEVSELRKSIRSCIDMQIMLQKSLNQHNHTAAKGKMSHDRAMKKETVVSAQT